MRAIATVVGATRYVVLPTLASSLLPQANEQSSTRPSLRHDLYPLLLPKPHYLSQNTNTHTLVVFCAFLHVLAKCSLVAPVVRVRGRCGPLWVRPCVRHALPGVKTQARPVSLPTRPSKAAKKGGGAEKQAAAAERKAAAAETAAA